MRIAIDLDGVIAQGVDYTNYEECRVVPGTTEYMLSLKDAGYYIIIYSARWEEDREVTELWLFAHGVPYNELILGKPLADIYLDDKALKFENWESAWNQIEKLSKRKS